MDAKALKALEVMKSCNDFNSIVTEGSLIVIRERYNILEEYTLHASLPGQCPYSKGSLGFSMSVDALEAGLRLPFHPIIEECLKWRRISPNASNQELNDTYCSLVDAYKQVQDLRARGRKMEDDLLKAIWELEMLPVEGGGGVQGDGWVQAGNPTDHPGLI
ncbi:hypothetical protein B296_00019078 [Ensete ventricosum]|uniref:Uncharacterized protein n=1 Tax=Ensete ventricosum TaxID=4639 RepID=A0A427ASX2_ENSVE|nr:hypothetical protein B296_00019078 [Ensete ventricosum]